VVGSKLFAKVSGTQVVHGVAASVPILAGAESLRSIAGRAVTVLGGELLV